MDSLKYTDLHTFSLFVRSSSVNATSELSVEPDVDNNKIDSI